MINANTVAKAYRELEREGVVELRQGAGAFVANTARARKAAPRNFAARSRSSRKRSASCARAVLSEDEIRRLFEAELAGFSKAGGQSG